MIPYRSNDVDLIAQFKIRADHFDFVAVVWIIGWDLNELCEDRPCEHCD